MNMYPHPLPRRQPGFVERNLGGILLLIAGVTIVLVFVVRCSS